MQHVVFHCSMTHVMQFISFHYCKFCFSPFKNNLFLDFGFFSLTKNINMKYNMLSPFYLRSKENMRIKITDSLNQFLISVTCHQLKNAFNIIQ